MKYVACRWLPGLNNVVIMPVAIHTDMFCIIGEEIQSGAGSALVLIFIFPAGLRTDPLARFNMTKSRASAGHDSSSPTKIPQAWARPAEAGNRKHFELSRLQRLGPNRKQEKCEIQFSDGIVALSITITSTGPFIACSFSPS
jgi:hypothetical protein